LLDAATKGLPGAALAIEGGKAIIFDIAGESSDLRAKEREIKGDRQRVLLQEQLRTELQAEIKHLTYVAVLSDSDRRQELGLVLSPESVPKLSPKEMERIGLGRTTREQWQHALFDGEGRLRVPAPSDSVRWTMFLRWAERANPGLRFEVDGLADKAYNAMNSVRSS
ncbi:MAG: hypothetical protein ACRECM_06520, partial [Methyloceanibacter sp.]